MCSISGTSSGKKKAVVASLSCSPDGRCSNVNMNDITVTCVIRTLCVVVATNRLFCMPRPPSKYGDASFECANVELTGDDVSLFGTCTTSD